MTKSADPSQKPSNKSYVRFELATRFTKADIQELEQWYETGEYAGCYTIDELVDRKLRLRKAARTPLRRRTLPKWLRPQCGAKTRAGSRCRATPVWDKKKDKPKNGRCRMHGGLSTGPKTEGGKRRALRNLNHVQLDM